jgi:hypothetical protein
MATVFWFDGEGRRQSAAPVQWANAGLHDPLAVYKYLKRAGEAVLPKPVSRLIRGDVDIRAKN